MCINIILAKLKQVRKFNRMQKGLPQSAPEFVEESIERELRRVEQSRDWLTAEI